MGNWTMAEAKKDFERGLLKGFEVFDASPVMGNDQGWSVSLQSELMPDSGGTLVDARTKQNRVFKTLDAAVGAARAIGFRALALQGK